MDHTHLYYSPYRVHSRSTWLEFIQWCKRIYRKMPRYSYTAAPEYWRSPLFLDGEFHYKKPKFNSRLVFFGGGNGTQRYYDEDDQEWYNRDSHNLTMDPLEIHRVKPLSLTIDICEIVNTGRRPYGMMVEACLILYRYFFPEVVLCFSGQEGDWDQAIGLISENFDISFDTRLNCIPFPTFEALQNYQETLWIEDCLIMIFEKILQNSKLNPMEHDFIRVYANLSFRDFLERIINQDDFITEDISHLDKNNAINIENGFFIIR